MSIDINFIIFYYLLILEKYKYAYFFLKFDTKILNNKSLNIVI